MIKKLCVITITLLTLTACQTLPKTTKNDEFSVSAQTLSKFHLYNALQKIYENNPNTSIEPYENCALKANKQMNVIAENYLQSVFNQDELSQLNQVLSNPTMFELVGKFGTTLTDYNLKPLNDDVKILAKQILESGLLDKLFHSYNMISQDKFLNSTYNIFRINDDEFLASNQPNLNLQKTFANLVDKHIAECHLN